MTQEKLGKLVITQRLPFEQPEDEPRGLPWFWLIAAPACLVLLAVLWQTGWLPAQFVPRKVIFRGCDLTPAAQVQGLLAARSGDSYLTWWRAARAAKKSAQRWVTGAGARPLAHRALLVTIQERKPVLRVESAGAGYWLCDDGATVRVQAADTQRAAFKPIIALPIVKLDGLPLANIPGVASSLLEAAALCAKALPGQITSLHVSAGGDFTLFDRTGLEIRLGQPADLAVKIGALPKALRAMSADRSHVAYLDATGALSGSRLVLYENRKQ